MPDLHGQVVHCYKHTSKILAEVQKHAADQTIDAVVLTPHWGWENSYRPNARQRNLARDAIEAGAIAVIGSHPHVIQPWEKHVTADGREGLIVYSTGNFLSNQRQLMQRAGAIVTLELTRSQQLVGAGRHATPKSRTRLSGAGYIPTWVVINGRGHRTVENTGRNRAALRRTQRIYPRGNRVAAARPFRLPKSCGSRTLGKSSPLLASER